MEFQHAVTIYSWLASALLGGIVIAERKLPAYWYVVVFLTGPLALLVLGNVPSKTESEL